MTELARLQIGVDTTQLAKGEAALEALAKEGARTEKAVAGVGRGAQTASAGVTRIGGVASNTGRQFQNAAFQVGDFATQVAGGQRASLALAQQLPQLLGGFGVLGAVMGAVVAIGGALIPVLFNSGEGAKSLADEIDELADALAALNRAQKASKTTFLDLRSEYGNYAGAAREILDVERQLAAVLAQQALGNSVAAISDVVGDLEDLRMEPLVGGVGALNEQLRRFSGFAPGAVNDVAKAFEVSADQAVLLVQEFENLAKAQGPEAQAEALRGLREQLELATGGYDAANDEALKLLQSLLDSEKAALLLAGIDMATGVAKAADEAARLRENLRISATGFGDRFDLSQVPGEGATEAVRQQRIAELQKAWRDRNNGGGAAKGGSAVDRFASDLEALQRSLKTEREFVAEWYAESQAILANQRAQELLGKEQHAEALLRVEQEYQSRLRDIQIKEQDTRLGYTATFFGAMAQATAAGGEKMAKAAQVFGAIEATVNAYRAAAQVLADPTVPFWGKAAAYASILATGLGAVAAIRGANSGGGAGAAAAPTAAAVQNTSPRVALTLNGNNFSRDQVRDLINAINEEVEGGAIVRLA